MGYANRRHLLAVGVEGARVGVEVLLRAELQAVHEEAGYDCVAVRLRLAHEGDVAFMQVAHGGYEGDAAGALQGCAQAGNRVMDLHRQ